MFPANISPNSFIHPAAVGNKTLIGGELAQPSEQCASYFSQLALSLLRTVHLIDNSANQHVTFSVILFPLSQNSTAGWKQTLGKPSDPAGHGWLPRCSAAASRHGRAGWDQYHIPPNASVCHLSEKVTRFRNYNFRRKFVQQPMNIGH